MSKTAFSATDGLNEASITDKLNALSLSPKNSTDPLFLHQRGTENMQQGKYKEAIPDFRLAIYFCRLRVKRINLSPRLEELANTLSPQNGVQTYEPYASALQNHSLQLIQVYQGLITPAAYK
jgi:hypothetical protein